MHNQGWKCPGCGRCYGPHVAQCQHCNDNPFIHPQYPQYPPTYPVPIEPMPHYPTIWCSRA